MRKRRIFEAECDEGKTRLEGGEGLRRGAGERTKVKESDREEKGVSSEGIESCPRKRSVGAVVPVRIMCCLADY